jgi:hypothetical protein
MRTQLSRMEVAMPEMCEQYKTLPPQMSQHGSTGPLAAIDVERQLYEWPAGLPRPASDENVENSAGSSTGTPLA